MAPCSLTPAPRRGRVRAQWGQACVRVRVRVRVRARVPWCGQSSVRVLCVLARCVLASDWWLTQCTSVTVCQAKGAIKACWPWGHDGRAMVHPSVESSTAALPAPHMAVHPTAVCVCVCLEERVRWKVLPTVGEGGETEGINFQPHPRYVERERGRAERERGRGKGDGVGRR